MATGDVVVQQLGVQAELQVKLHSDGQNDGATSL